MTSREMQEDTLKVAMSDNNGFVKEVFREMLHSLLFFDHLTFRNHH
jgi:hypothetical protein